MDSSFELSQQRCSELEEQVQQQQKVIRYLQAQMESNKGQASSNQQQLLTECERLRQQLTVLQLNASTAGGGTSALQQQVLLLQVGCKGNHLTPVLHIPLNQMSFPQIKHGIWVAGA